MTYPTQLHLLALDMATTCGYARLASGVVTSGSQCFERHKGNKSRGPDHVGASHAMFDNWLTEQLRGPKIDGVIYEQAGHFKSAAAVQICVGFRGVLLAKCAKHNLPMFSYSPSALKKFFTGNGRADKDMMLRAAQLKFPHESWVDDNCVDAFALLHMHLATAH